MFSKSKLIPFLKDNGFITDEEKVSYETYGKETYAYIGVADMPTRFRLEQSLRQAKQKVNPNYSAGRPTVEVRVTYFKSFGWDK
jgi:hypothetical protein